jgi:hypothetical protein
MVMVITIIPQAARVTRNVGGSKELKALVTPTLRVL